MSLVFKFVIMPLFFKTAKILAKRTDNKIDDTVVEIINNALFCNRKG